MLPTPLANLVNELSKLPGIGAKTASRLAYGILRKPAGEAEALAEAILEVRRRIIRCGTCNNLTDVDPCALCADDRRDRATLCVVEEAASAHFEPGDGFSVLDARGYGDTVVRFVAALAA